MPTSQVTKPDRPDLLSTYRPLLPVLAAIAAGIVCERWFRVSPVLGWTIAAMALAVWFPLIRRTRITAAAVCLFVAFVGLGTVWHHAQWRTYDATELAWFADDTPQPVCLEARVIRQVYRLPADSGSALSPIPQPPRTMFEVEVTRLRNGTAWQPATGRARLLVRSEVLGVESGDYIRLFGEVSRPSKPRNPGEFDLAAHRRADRLLIFLAADFADCLHRIPQPEQATTGHSGIIPAALDSLRWSVRQHLEQLRDIGVGIIGTQIPSPRAELASAVLLGRREEVPPELNDRLLTSGTLHILAISGLHVGIVAGLVFWLSRFFCRRYNTRRVVVVVAAIAYTALAGAPPSAVRACVLVAAFCLAGIMDRQADTFNSLALAAIVVLLANPCDLFRTGFQLSFLAAGTLIAYDILVVKRRRSDPLMELWWAYRPWLARKARRLGAVTGDILLAGVCLWCVSAPLVLARFGICAPIAVAVHVIAWLPLTLAIASGMVLLIAGILAPPLAVPAGWLCNAGFAVLEGIVHGASQVPGGHFWSAGPADWWLLGFYGLLLGGLFAPRSKGFSAARAAVALTAWAGIGLAAAAATRYAAQPHVNCTVLSVGHGCAVVVELPDGRVLLYDAGSFGNPRRTAQTVARFLWQRNKHHIDTVILSHPDIDHFNALPEMTDYVSVGKVYVSPVMFDIGSPSLDALRAALRQRHIPVEQLAAGETATTGGDCRIEVLHPLADGIPGGDNANSIVLAVSYQGYRVLLPGDLESPGLEMLLSEMPLPCDVLLAPHHGSRASNPPGLIQWCAPRWIVISGDRRQVDASLPEDPRGAGILHTAVHGAIAIRMDRTGCRVSWHRSETPPLTGVQKRIASNMGQRRAAATAASSSHPVADSQTAGNIRDAVTCDISSVQPVSFRLLSCFSGRTDDGFGARNHGLPALGIPDADAQIRKLLDERSERPRPARLGAGFGQLLQGHEGLDGVDCVSETPNHCERRCQADDEQRSPKRRTFS